MDAPERKHLPLYAEARLQTSAGLYRPFRRMSDADPTHLLVSRLALKVTLMPRKQTTREEFDSPWKDALQTYLQAFLAFFFSDIHDDLDWIRGYESFDKEFQRIIRESRTGKLLAD